MVFRIELTVADFATIPFEVSNFFVFENVLLSVIFYANVSFCQAFKVIFPDFTSLVYL